MSQLIFAQAKAMLKRAKRDAGRIFERDDPMYEEQIAGSIQRQKIEFKEILCLSKELHDMYVEVMQTDTRNHFFITVRPRPDIPWNIFYACVLKYVKRAFMLTYTLSFEQKSLEGTGEGFHVHIVAHTKHRSKGECLRDTISTFKSICDDNCIQVNTTRNGAQIVQNYLVDYKSDDNHKESTKDGDQVWRRRMGLDALYDSASNPLGLSIKSVDSP